MRTFLIFGTSILFAVAVWAADWPMPGGNPQRNGWAGSERLISKANVSSLRLLYKYQSDNQPNGLATLTAPIINGNLITYRGFKEMLVFAGGSGKVFSVDADLNKLIWDTNLPYTASDPPNRALASACPGGLAAPVIMAGSSSASLHFAALAARTPAGRSIRAARPSPYLPALEQSVYPLLPATLTRLNALYTVTSDGYLHVLNSSTGQDLITAVRFVPANAKVTSLNLRDNVVYATTADHCDGYLNAIFAIDLLSPQKAVTSFAVPLGGFAGTAGTTIGNDGTVYVQAAYAPDKQKKRFYEAVLALTPKSLSLKDYFIVSNKPLKIGQDEESGISPVVFSFPERDLILAGGRDGRLYLLDSRSLGGADHRTALFASAVLAPSNKTNAAGGFRGRFSTWMDVDTGIRRVYAPVSGDERRIRAALAPNRGAAVKERSADGSAGGFILALGLAGTKEKPTLNPLWISREMLSPAPAVIANGMAFVLSTKPARLYVLDALTGKQLYASEELPTSASVSTALAVANGRAYFSARDNAVYCFGIPAQQRQLVEQ
jgi:outer membrane protein assembly factor BamB